MTVTLQAARTENRADLQTGAALNKYESQVFSDSPSSRVYLPSTEAPSFGSECCDFEHSRTRPKGKSDFPGQRPRFWSSAQDQNISRTSRVFCRLPSPAFPNPILGTH